MRAHAGRGRPLAIDTAHTSIQHIGPMGGLHGRGGRGCGGIPCHHENLGPLGVPGSRMPVQPPGARTSGSLPRARPNLGLHAYLRPAHASQLCIEHGCKGDNMSSLSTAVPGTAVQCVTSTREAYRLLVIVGFVGFKCQAFRPFTLGRPAPEGQVTGYPHPRARAAPP